MVGPGSMQSRFPRHRIREVRGMEAREQEAREQEARGQEAREVLLVRLEPQEPLGSVRVFRGR
jgi:hypothetical protein